MLSTLPINLGAKSGVLTEVVVVVVAEGVACGLDVGAAGDVCGWVLVLGKSGADTR